MSQLPGDCLNDIFEYFVEDKVTLYSCLLEYYGAMFGSFINIENQINHYKFLVLNCLSS